MTLLSTAAQNKSLDNDYGSSKGANAAASHKVAMYAGDPATTGTELAATGGYAQVTLTNNGTSWPSVAAGGAKTSMQITFPTSTAAWSDVATHFLLLDATTGDEWDSGPLSAELSVDQAGVIAKVTLTVFYNPAF